MPRPLFTFALVALLAAGTLAILYVRLGQAHRELEARLTATVDHADRLATELTAAKQQNSGLQASIAGLDADLGATRGKLIASEARADKLSRDFTETKSLLTLQQQNAKALAVEVASLKADLAEARASHATPEAVAAYRSTIADLERQLAVASNGAVAPGSAGAATAVFASRRGRSTVLSVGPENAFVVVDFGAERGAVIGQQLTLNHGTESLATALISDVRTSFSVAQVQPDSLHGVLQKGDLAVLVP